MIEYPRKRHANQASPQSLRSSKQGLTNVDIEVMINIVLVPAKNRAEEPNLSSDRYSPAPLTPRSLTTDWSNCSIILDNFPTKPVSSRLLSTSEACYRHPW